jgi:predicted TIM-barrel fold metal-dependent hydrolase
MRAAGRFVVEVHAHITTLYKPKGDNATDDWDGLPMTPEQGEVAHYDNSAMTLYDMERYGVDMCLLKPSMTGTTNDFHAELVKKYPDKFRSFCADQNLKIKVARGEAKWTLDAAAEEVEAALKTGNFIGIGEFVPKDMNPKKIYTFEERLNEYRVFMEMARKYGVSVDFHDSTMPYEWDPYALLSRISSEYPDVPIVFCHSGYSIGSYAIGSAVVRKAVAVAGRAVGPGGANIFLECGNWPAEYFKYALQDPNVGVSQLIWGADYGHVPQYIVTNPGGDPSSYTTAMRRWPKIPTYQPDWWGWELHQIDKLRDYITQDDINLILGGNAVRIWDLPVPHSRMFMSGRPDVWGVYWQDSIPEEDQQDIFIAPRFLKP